MARLMSMMPNVPPTLSMPACLPRAFSFTPSAGEDGTALLERVSRTLRAEGLTPAMAMVFGLRSVLASIPALLRGLPGGADWPVLLVEGRPCGRGPLCGVQVYAAPAGMVERVRLGGSVVGSVVADASARHCLLAGIGPDNAMAAEDAQTERTFDRLEASLAAAGFDLADVVRTWFYNRNILAWYPVFNRVRTARYGRHPFRSGSLPASTGIEGANPAGAALTLAAWAIRPRAPEATAREVLSPLQCPAPQYGSSFSRAFEIAHSGRRRLFVSGTASIALAGATLWPDDPARQIEQTMTVIDALLAARGLTLADTDRAIAYFKNPGDRPRFEAWLARNGLAGLPHIALTCDVCRPDLLFELELDASA